MNRLFPTLRLAAALFVFACAQLFSPAALAQPAGAQGNDFIYRVAQNDTLIQLAERFTNNSQLWQTLQALNAVEDPLRLPIGKEIRIPFRLIPEQPAQATVTHITGTVRNGEQSLAAGDLISEGDTITSEANGFATLTLTDGSTLTIPPQSSLSLDRLRVFKGTGLTDTISNLKQGSLESHVAPQNTGVGRFEIRSPVSVTGVRGTQLRVHASEQGAHSEVLEGVAGLSSQQSAPARLKAGQGALVDQGGTLQGVRPLLPAPALSVPERGNAGWVVSFPPVPGADSYLVRVARDPEGVQLVSSQRFDTPSVSFRAPGSGTFYVLVRGIDAQGLNGMDAIQPFLGQATLQTSDGSSVSTSFDLLVTLNDY